MSKFLQKSASDIYKTLYKFNLEEFEQLDFSGKDIDKSKIRPFFEIIKDLTDTKSVSAKLEKFNQTEFTPDEITLISNLKTHLTRTSHFSETIDKHNKGVLETIARDRIGKMKDSGMTAEEVLTVLRNNESIESFTTHPTYTGSPEYTKAHSEYLQNISDYFEGKVGPEKVKESINKILSNDFNKQERLTVDDEREYMINQLVNVDASIELVYKTYDEMMKELYGNDYNPKDLKITYKKHVWGAGCDVDGNTAIFWEDTAKTFQELIAEGINKNIENLKSLNDERAGEIVAELESFKADILEDITVDRSEQYNKLSSKVREITETILDETNSKDALKAFRYARDNGLLLGKGEYRQTAEVFDDVLKNIIPLDIIKEFAGDDIKDSVKNFADLTDLSKIKLENFKNVINQKLTEINDRSEKFKFLENYDELQSYLSNPHELDRRQKDIFSEISYEISTIVQQKVTENILKDKERFAGEVLGSWLEKAEHDLEYKMAANPDVKNSVTKTYDHEDSFFYQEVNRYKLVKNNPFMMDTDVMAEANKANDVFKKMILQRAVGVGHLRNVKLYESPEILKDIDKVLEEGYKNTVYFQELVRVGMMRFEEKHSVQIPEDIKKDLLALDPTNDYDSGKFGKEIESLDSRIKGEFKDLFKIRKCDTKEDFSPIGISAIIKEEIQIAHSDNGRRAGLQAARMIISKAVRVGNSVAKAFGAAINYFHGWSVTDSQRGGMRAPSRMFNQYGNFGFQKHTTQNMDGHVIYPNAKSGSIFVMDKVTNAALNISRNYGAAVDDREFASKDGRDAIRMINRELMLGQRLRDLDNKYKDDFYYNEAPGYEMAQVQNGAKHGAFGNVASRRNSRKKAKEGVDVNYYQQPSSVRSISVSESAQHAGDHNFYVMAKDVKDVIYNVAESIKYEIEEGNSKNTELYAKVFGVEPTVEQIIKKMTDLDPDLQELKNRGAQSVAFADLDHIWERAQGDIIHKSGQGVYEKINGRPKLEELEEVSKTKANSVNGLLAWRQMHHQAQAELVYVMDMGIKPEKNMTPERASEVVMPSLNDFNKKHSKLNKVGLAFMSFLDNKLEDNFIGKTIKEKLADPLYNMAQKAMHLSADIAIFTNSPIKSPAPVEQSIENKVGRGGRG